MRILVTLPYSPSRTRVRSRMLLRELVQRHDITLVALAWNSEDEAELRDWHERGFEVYTVPHGPRARAAALLGDPRRPLQQIASTSNSFAQLARRLITDAAKRGRPYDAVHVEHLRGAAALRLTRNLGVRTVFDAVDCIAELARLTRRGQPNPLVRALATIEEARTERLESALIAAADVVTVVAERDRAALVAGGAPARILVVPNGVVAADRPLALTDEPVAVFTGKLSYHANQAALRWLLADIWPRVRATLPAARLIVAGAHPPAWARQASGSDGVQVIANPPEMEPLLAQARVALAPMVYSVGIQNKVLEAMGVGLPVIASPSAAQGLLATADRCFVLADGQDCFARRTIQLLEDTALARWIGRAGYDYARREHSWPVAAARFEALYRGTPAEMKVA